MSKKTIVRWFTSIPFFILLGLILGGLISIPIIPKPNIAIIGISGIIFEQADVDNILDELRSARDDRSIKAVVLQIDSPGGTVNAVEAIYWEVLQLKQYKPVVTSIRRVAASGGYYIAIASDFIYAQPSSSVGSIGVRGILPSPEKLDEDTITTGPFKATGSSRRNALSEIATIKQRFVAAVISQRGERLNMSDIDLSQAVLYSGTESLGYGLIDGIGTITSAIQKAVGLSHIRNYGFEEWRIQCPESVDLGEIRAQPNITPLYYYLYVELE